MAVVVPFYKMNYLLFNCKRKFWDVSSGYRFSFYEYVKSQLHFPITPSLYDRDLNDYKKVYLFLKGESPLDKSSLGRVLRYFYFDLYNSFRMADVEDFSLDYSGIEDLYEHQHVPNGSTISEMLIELNRAYACDNLYLVYIGGDSV